MKETSWSLGTSISNFLEMAEGKAFWVGLTPAEMQAPYNRHTCPDFHAVPGMWGHLPPSQLLSSTHRLKTWQERAQGSSSLTLLDSVPEK